jgi:hypothetical protein
MQLAVTAPNVISISPNVPLLIQLLKLARRISRPIRYRALGPNDIGLNELKVVMCLGGARVD